MIIPGDVYSPRAGAPGGAYSIRPYTGTHLNEPTGLRPQQTNNSTGRLRTPANLAGYPKGCPAFFACTNLPLWSAITIRSYRYIPFNIFFDSTEKHTIFVANFHVRCR